MRRTVVSGLVVLSSICSTLLPACGDDSTPSRPDAGAPPPVDASSPDARADAASMPACTGDGDCAHPPMACAIGYCQERRCVYSGLDEDGDGHITAECPIRPPDGFPTDDCDDHNAVVYPGAPEVCDDADTDCDPLTVGIRDADADGYTDVRCSNTDTTTGETYYGEDCEDGDANVHPGADDGPRANCNGVDDDCDGMRDEGCACTADVPCGGAPDGVHDVDPATCRRGVQRCADGTLMAACEGAVGPAAEACDIEHRDEDCDGIANEPDVCECANGETRLCGPEGVDFGARSACRRGTQSCAGGRWQACMDAIYPSAEVCEGNLDESCDGTVDEGCACTMGQMRACGGHGGMGICRPGTQTCDAGGTWSADCIGEVLPRAELCEGAVDDDCDGVIDNGCGCRVGETRPCGGGPVNGGTSACRQGTQRCVTGGTWDTCTGNVDPAIELCDATMTDEDCDGSRNEDCEIVQVASGTVSTCALRRNGHVMCWGNNAYGQLGNGSSGMGMVVPTPVEVRGLTGAVEISAGFAHACARRTGGGVACWGLNEYGQLGNGASGMGLLEATPVTVTGLSDATRISAGTAATCAIRGSGDVVCWGVMPGTTTVDAVPTIVSGISYPTTLDVGNGHLCAITPGGSVLCLGANTYGQLGDGTMSSRPSPLPAIGVSAASAVGLGNGHTCAVVGAGDMMCWGANYAAQLCDGSLTDRPTPVPAAMGITEAAQIASGERHTCARLRSGWVWCWGSDQYGQLGDAATHSMPQTTPVTGVLSAVADISAGDRHTCAVAAGRVMCWGWNVNGQLGRGDLVDMVGPMPAPVVNLPW